MRGMHMIQTNDPLKVTEWGYLQMGDVQPVQTFTTTTPRVCSGDTHVFPCQRCNTCQCGKAKVQR